jgi:hypothetical protein
MFQVMAAIRHRQDRNAALCGVQNAHIGTISSQWGDDEKPRIKTIKSNLAKAGFTSAAAHIELIHGGQLQYCYPAEICLAVLEYYAFDAGANCQPEARDNFRLLAGSKLREMIYSQVGYDPAHLKRFDKWHERIGLNYQSAPKGFFHVFNEAHTVVYELIMAGADIGERTWSISLSASIGQSTGPIMIWSQPTAPAQNIPIVTRKVIPNRNPTRRNRGATRWRLWVLIEHGFRMYISRAASSARTSRARYRGAISRRL